MPARVRGTRAPAAPLGDGLRQWLSRNDLRCRAYGGKADALLASEIRGTGLAKAQRRSVFSAESFTVNSAELGLAFYRRSPYPGETRGFAGLEFPAALSIA